MASSYIPKYQHQAIMNKRQGKNMVTFKYQKMRKDGTWGAVREGDNKYYCKATPQEVIEKWEEMNPGHRYRLVEA